MIKLTYQAEDFLNAYHILQEHSHASAPIIVCLSFAAELYLKNLYGVLGHSVPEGHDLWVLFRRLPNKVKQSIYNHESIKQMEPFLNEFPLWDVRRYTEKCCFKRAFKKQLQEISNGFIHWRYAHEHRKLNYESGFALTFISVLREIGQKISEDNIKNPAK